MNKYKRKKAADEASEERIGGKDERDRIKLGALFAPSELTSPCEALRKSYKMHLLVLIWC